MTEPLHVAFIWHMHQPCYRSAVTGAFEMPWVRMHALKDYLDMIETLEAYPAVHQTFNLVPSLVEQLEAYAAGDFSDGYWQHTLKPADALTSVERAFVVERMCDHSDHPRARSHPRYLELARMREALIARGAEACAGAFSVADIRDLQVWFNLAWFDPKALEADPLAELVRRGRDFREEDKELLAEVQRDILVRTLPAYHDAALRGQVELSTSPYFHPILPLLANTDSARIASADAVLPPKRFAHPEDAREHIQRAMTKHESVFGRPAAGMWCSEQAVGEDVIPLLLDAGVVWTVADETTLARSLSGAAQFGASRGDGLRSIALAGIASGGMGSARATSGGTSGPLAPEALYAPYRLEREGGELAIIFRDHTLSDLIGFAYQSWDSKDAANDLLYRLRGIRSALSPAVITDSRQGRVSSQAAPSLPLVTIALDGENAWEYYPRDGRDFLCYLYEGLSADPAFRCVTVSEHIQESPPTRSLGWLHTGSWIGGDLRTWIGDPAHNAAWYLLHSARDLAASRRQPSPGRQQITPAAVEVASNHEVVEEAWCHVLAAEGSDWFWWFGEHHHTELDHLWDLSFRQHLQEVFRVLGEPIPTELFLPLLESGAASLPAFPRGDITPVIDGLLGAGLEDATEEWAAAGVLAPEYSSTMQRAEGTKIREARFGWNGEQLCLLIVPTSPAFLPELEVELRIAGLAEMGDLTVRMTLETEGRVRIECPGSPHLAATAAAAWREVLEASLPVGVPAAEACPHVSLVLRVGRHGMTEHVFHAVDPGVSA